MMKKFPNLCLGISLLFLNPPLLSAQEAEPTEAVALAAAMMGNNKTFEVVVDENGNESFREVGPSDAASSQSSTFIEVQTAIMDARSPLNLILSKFNPEKLSLAVEQELTKEQRQKLADLSKQFQQQAKGKSGFDLDNLKKECYVGLKEILLPEQLKSIRNFRVDDGVFNFISQPKVAKHLGLKAAKVDEIGVKCRLANKVVADAIVEQQMLLDKMRSEMDGIMNSMTDEQKEKLGKLLDKKVERYFDNFDLHSMLKTTDVPDDKL